ncbi:hypothetical protein HK096_009129, partial [Nowakowskiella sp. JEL0078]
MAKKAEIEMASVCIYIEFEMRICIRENRPVKKQHSATAGWLTFESTLVMKKDEENEPAKPGPLDRGIVEFILSCGSLLKLFVFHILHLFFVSLIKRRPSTTISTALLYYHRYQSFYRTLEVTMEQNPRDSTIYKNCIDLLERKLDNHVRSQELLNNSEDDGGYLDVNEGSELYGNLRDSLVAAELMVLRVLKFETNVDLAHPPLMIIIHSLWTLYTAHMNSDQTVRSFENKFNNLSRLSHSLVCDVYADPLIAISQS